MNAEKAELRRRVEDFLARPAEAAAEMSPADTEGMFLSIRECYEALESAHAELVESQACHSRILAAIDAGPLVVFVWRIEDSGPLEYVSENVAQFGYTSTEFMSGAVSWPGITHPDDLARLERNLSRYMAEGMDELFQEYRLITKDGHTRWVDDRTVAIKDGHGRTTHFTGAIRDITERKDAKQQILDLNIDLESRVKRRTQQLEESETKYRYLSENTQDIHYIMTPDGVIHYIGPQVHRYGYTQDDFLKHSFAALVHEDDRARLTDELRRTVETGETFPSEFRIHDPDGGMHWFEERSAAEFDGDGQLVRLTGLLRDVTARKNAEQGLVENQARLRRLAAKLASAQDEEQRRIAEGLHDDVAQLLTACSVKLAIARGSNTPDAVDAAMGDAEKMLAEVQESVRLLSFELASSTLYKLGFVDAVHELCDGMRDRYGAVFDVNGDLGGLTLDHATSTVLFKAVRELVFNVVKHASVNRGQVALFSENGFVRITVRDEGKGFSRVPDGQIIGSGEGYGLFSIQERLRDLGGRMEITSTEGVETCVTLWSPFKGDALVEEHG